MIKTVVLLCLFMWSKTIIGQSQKPIERCLTNNEHDDRYTSYSPNGEWIVFESNRTEDWEIYLMDKEGRNIERITINNRTNRRPSWHPNAKTILFESVENGSQELRTIKIKNLREKVLAAPSIGAKFLFASFAPNGKTIAVSFKESEDRSNIVLLNIRGVLKRKITNNEWRNYYPKWSNDGKELLCFSRKETANEDDEIYRINIESGTEHRLTNWKKHNFCPAWSSDGSKIV